MGRVSAEDLRAVFVGLVCGSAFVIALVAVGFLLERARRRRDARSVEEYFASRQLS